MMRRTGKSEFSDRDFKPARMKDDSSAIVNMLETMKKPESLSEETKKL